VEDPASEVRQALAVIGMACRFPGARDPDELWRNLRDGVESILRLSEEDLDEAGIPLALRRDPRFVAAGTLVDGFDRFDTALFGIDSAEAAALDPQLRVFLECAWQALEQAGCDPIRRAETTAVFASAAVNGYCSRAHGAAPADRRWRGEPADLAGFVSACLGLRGPSLNVQSACSSSLVAVHLACESLLAGRCDLALAGGVSIRLPQKSGYLHEEGGITSPNGRCRPFDARADGTVFGSGAGVIVLKRLADALAERDPIAAVILGSAVNNDGAGKPGFTAPIAAAQAQVISLAQAVAGVRPEEISYIEGHGTGTLLGDALELEALTQVFGTRAEERWCALGSVKANLGHLETASGVAGLIKAILALENRLLLPSPGFERPHPELEAAASPFFVSAQPAAWEAAATPRRAGVSSFGIGGTNAHLVLEEAPPPPSPEPSRSSQLLVLSAASERALAARAAAVADHLARRPDLSLADIAWTLQTGRRALPFRRAVVCADLSQAATVEAVEGRVASVPPEVLQSPARLDVGPAGLEIGSEGLLLEIRPGCSGVEGSLWQGMLADLGRLWVSGVEVDWPALHAGEKRSRVRLPTYPLEGPRCWLSSQEKAELPLPDAPPAPPAAGLPLKERERLLCEIWQEVLGIAEVGVGDHFLELGGDSILGALVASRARAAGLAITPEHLFLHPTVTQLAAAAGTVERKEAGTVMASTFAPDPAAVKRLLAKRSFGR
jgi:acyl transferase domain-containing protein